MTVAAPPRPRPSLLPSRREEGWRVTDLRGLLRVLPPPRARRSSRREGPFAGLGGDELAVGNGRCGASRPIADGPASLWRACALWLRPGPGRTARGWRWR